MSDASVSAVDGRAVVRVGGSELLAPIVKTASDAMADTAANRSATEMAAATALAGSRYFPTRVAGQSGSTPGQMFSTDDGAGNLLYYRRTSSGSDEIGRAVTPASLASSDGSARVGFRQMGTGAANRTLEDKARARIDLDDFVLPGDLDYSDAIGRAIDRLIELGGGICKAAARHHAMSRAIEFDTGSNDISIWFEGEGLSTTFDQYGPNEPAMRVGQTQRLRSSGLRNLRLRCLSGNAPGTEPGDVLEIGALGFEHFDMEQVDLEQYNSNRRLIHAPYGNMFYLRATGYWRGPEGATVNPVFIRTQDTTFNHNVIDITAYCANSSKRFFDIESEAGGSWLFDNQIKAVFQNCSGGAIRFCNAKGWKLNFNFWDLSDAAGYRNDLVLADSNAQLESIECDITINRHDPLMANGVRDIRLVGGQDFRILVLTNQSANPTYDWGNKRLKVNGRPYTEINFDQAELGTADKRRFVNTFTQLSYADVFHIGGLMRPDMGTISAASGFIELKSNVANTGFLFNALSGSNTEHKLAFSPDGASFYSLTDNFTTLGLPSQRYGVVYSGTGAISTSDARLKDWRGGLNAAEIAATKEIAAAIGIYRFLDSLDEKGGAARLHVGAKAQQVVEIMQSQGLDAFAYGFVCYDEWNAVAAVVEPARAAVVDAQGAEVKPAVPESITIPAQAAGNRYGLRYDELAMFLAAGQEIRLLELERLANP